jgi:hypothetical protein
MMNKYMKPRGLRREGQTLGGRFRGGVLAPVLITPLRGSESGSLTQSITFELDPVAGRMITEVTAEVISVYVPVQAMDALANPEEAYPGNSEVIRAKLLSGAPLFGVEPEHEISKRLGVEPRSVSGSKVVSTTVRLAHNAAINHLRQRKYVHAVQVLASSTAITPALISQTVLDRLNAVLDPEDRVNGKVSLTGKISVKGIGVFGAPVGNSGAVKESNVGTATRNYADYFTEDQAGHKIAIEENPDRAGFPNIFADLADAADVSLSDFYTAQRMDALTREMRKIVDDNPEFGEELVARWAHGLNVDTGKQPFVVYENRNVIGSVQDRASDGANLGKVQTNLAGAVTFSVPLPPTEFGGIVITFAAIKPDEALASQPHPVLSQEWGAINFVADEMAIDPVPVTIRDLYADCEVEDEATVVCYIGNNHLLKTYLHYGFNRHIDPTTVESKSAMWQLEIPMSVTPESVLYPATLDHYPFVDNLAEVCTYTASAMATISTPYIFGPNPVEELAAIEDADIFEDGE